MFVDDMDGLAVRFCRKRPVRTVAYDGRFRDEGREVGMAESGWLGERRLCGFFGGDHLLVNQTFISPGYSH